MTKQEQLNQEDRAIVNQMDKEAETKTKLLEDNKIMLSALREIAVKYPEDNNADSAEILCKYLIALAQSAISKINIL